MSAAVARLGADQPQSHFDRTRVDKYFKSEEPYQETLLFLRPVPLPDGTKRHPRKRITVADDGTLRADKSAFRLKTFSGELVTVDGIRSLHEAVRTRGLAGETVLVAGLPSPKADLRRMRRTNELIADRPSRILVADVDGLPNHAAVDPAANPAGAADSIRALLPPSLRRAAMSAAFSSSTGLCAGVPLVLSLHLRAWADGAMEESERVKLVQAIGRYALNSLPEAGVEPAGAIDHALARPTQLQSIAAPEMPEGHDDPFAGSTRHVLLDGDDTFRLDTLLAELSPFLEATRTAPPKSPKPAARRAGPLPPVDGAALRGLAVPDQRDALPQAIRDALGRATRMLHPGRPKRAGREQAARQAHAAQCVLDLVRWVRTRVAWGASVPALAAWHRAGGVPEGLRDEFMVILHSRLGYALQGRGVATIPATAEDSRGSTFTDALAAVAGCCVDAAWFDKEWMGAGYHGSVSDRLERSRAGERVEWQGSMRAPLYWHRKSTITDILGIHDAEAELLGLASLSPRAARERMKRRAEGARPAVAVESEAGALRAKARRLRGRGLTHAAIAAACGRSETWARAASEGIRPAVGGVERATGDTRVINPKFGAGTVGRQGSREERIRTPYVTSKGGVPSKKPLLPAGAPGEGKPRPTGAWTGTPESRTPGTPCTGVHARDTDVPAPRQHDAGIMPCRDRAENALDGPGMSESARGTAAIPPDHAHLPGGLGNEPEGPLGASIPHSVEPHPSDVGPGQGPYGAEDFVLLDVTGLDGDEGADGRGLAAAEAEEAELSAADDGAGEWDARSPVPRGPFPVFGGWAWRGRHAQRRGQAVWVSGAGVVVRRGDRACEGAPDWVKAGFMVAREAAYGPRREALRLQEERAKRDANATTAERDYRAWLASQGREEAPVVVPPEPRAWEVPGTKDWLADGVSRVIRVLKRRDWRQGLEALRVAEPLLVGAIVASIPTPGEETAAWADGLAREAARVERSKGAESEAAPAAGQRFPGARPFVRRTAPSLTATASVRPGTRRRLRTTFDEADLRAMAMDVDDD